MLGFINIYKFTNMKNTLIFLLLFLSSKLSAQTVSLDTPAGLNYSNIQPIQLNIFQQDVYLSRVYLNSTKLSTVFAALTYYVEYQNPIDSSQWITQYTGQFFVPVYGGYSVDSSFAGAFRYFRDSVKINGLTSNIQFK